ncbi:1453_t:CDS:1, partial [Acaulospora colombiana]
YLRSYKGVLDYEPYFITNPRPDPMSRSVINSPDAAMKKDLPAQKAKAMPAALPLADLLTDGVDGAVPVKRKKGAAAQEWESIVKMKSNISSGRQSQADGLSREQGQNDSGPTSSPMKKGWEMTQSPHVGAGQGWARRQPSKKSNGTGELSKSRATISAVPLPDEVDQKRTSKHTISFLGKISRNNAFAEDKPEGSNAEPTKNPGSANLDPRQIFTGCTFLLLGDASCDSVSLALQQAGGTVIMEGSPNYYVVRFVG